MDGVIDVFVNEDIGLQLARNAKLDPARLERLLAPEEVEVQKVTKSRKYVL